MSTKRQPKARRQRSRQDSVSQSIVVIRGANPVPKAIQVTLPYTEVIFQDPTSGTAVAQFWNLTGPFDPNNTGTGTQPLAFDSYMAQYNQYCVLSCAWDVLAYSQAADNTGQCIIAHGVTDDNSASLDAALLWQQPTYKVTPLGSIGSAHDIVRFHGSLDIAKQFGLTRAALLASTAHCGTAAAIPAENSFLQVVVAANNSTVNPANVVTWTKLEYTVVFTERKELAAS